MRKVIAAALAGVATIGAMSIPASGALATGANVASPDKVTAIVGAVVFDGTGAAPKTATVLIRGDRIIAVGSDVKVPAGAKIVNAKGKALTPGFYDLHTHWTNSGDPATYPQIATDYVKAGITTVNDFHQQPEAFEPLRAWLATLVAPHVNFVARISTPGGHGADWADQATTKWVNTPELAQAAITSLVPYKPDVIKVFADGWRYGVAPDNTSMDGWTLSALTEAAHKQGWKVVTHTVTVERGLLAAKSGVDSLAHGMQDRLLTAEEVATIKASGMAEIPTLAVYDPNKDPNHQMDPAIPREKQRIDKFNYALKNAKMLFDAGVPIAVGTDAGMSKTPHGPSTLHELELLVRAGLTPAQALKAASWGSAHLLAQDGDRGTIEVGKRADILLFDAKPWDDIANIHKLAMTMIDGKPVWGLGAPALPAANGEKQLKPKPALALIDDFERADGRSSLDTLRLDTPDGGNDRTTQITETVPRDGGGQALLITARMAMKEDAYAGTAVPLFRGSVQPANVNAFKGVRLDLRGDSTCAGKLTVNGTAGFSWAAPLAISGEWSTVDIPFSALSTKDARKSKPWSGTDIVEVEVGAGCSAGKKLWLQMDNLRFY